MKKMLMAFALCASMMLPGQDNPPEGMDTLSFPLATFGCIFPANHDDETDEERAKRMAEEEAEQKEWDKQTERKWKARFSEKGLELTWPEGSSIVSRSEGLTVYLRVTNTPDLATRAAAYNVEYAVVDGTDALAVYEAMKTAMEHARSGKGPYVVEAKVYRYQGHYCGDPAVYRPAEYMEYALKHDGIEKLANRLHDLGVTDEELEEIKAAATAEMDAAVKFADESPYPDPSEVTDDMYTADNERCVAR